MMDIQIVVLIIAALALIAACLSLVLFNNLQQKYNNKSNDFNTRPLQLQAYERLVLLSDRIGLANLISRVSQPGLTAKQMQLLLIESIKQEFEHNTSQQIYVTKNAWDVVKQLKEQNILLINQVSATLPATASGNDLNRQLLEFTMSSNKGTLHEIVSEALSYEAKKIIK